MHHASLANVVVLIVNDDLEAGCLTDADNPSCEYKRPQHAKLLGVGMLRLHLILLSWAWLSVDFTIHYCHFGLGRPQVLQFNTIILGLVVL